MSGPGNETLTAALRRLADERSSGLLSVATPGRDVVVELDEGTPVAIGPTHDVEDRVGSDAPDGLTTVAVVDELLDRMVAAIVTGEVEWTWDVPSDGPRLPVPPGLTQELARRAVDAAQALAALEPDDVLEPARAVPTTGELDQVRELFDGERSLAEVAEAAGLTLPTVATMAAALVAGGALSLDEPATDEPEPMSWTDTVAAADDEDEDDDEPELWVMEPPEDEEDEDEEDEPPAAAQAPARSLSVSRPTLRDVAPPPAADPTPEDDAAEDADLDDDTPLPAEQPAPAAAAAPEPAAVAPDPDPDPAPSTTDDVDAPAASWNDTSWLDELSPTDVAEGAPPVLAAGDEDAHDALGSMLSDLEDEELFGPRSSDEEPAPAAGADDDADAPDEPTPPARREPRAEPGDVAEFLRELSRLALDDD